MGRQDVIKQPLVMVIATFLAMMTIIVCRVAVSPYPFEVGITADMPLGRLIDGVTGASVTLTYVLGIIIAFLSATLLTSILVRYSVSFVRTYLPMIVYTMTAFGVSIPIGSLSASLVSFILILSSADMIAAFRRSYQFGNVFRSAFAFGILPMIYATSVVLVLIIPITLVLYQRTPREWIAAAAGLFLPFLICSIGWWAIGESFEFVSNSLIKNVFSESFMSVREVFLTSDLPVKIYICVYAALAFYSIFVIFRRITGMRTRARKIYLHFIWLLLLCIIMTFLPSSNIISLGLLAVPGSVVVSAFFIKYKGWVPVLVYILLLGLVFWINLAPLL